MDETNKWAAMWNRKAKESTGCVPMCPWQEPTLPAPSASGPTGRSRCDSSLNLPLMLLFCGPTARSASKDPLLRWNVDQVVLLNHNGKPIVCHPHVQRDNRATVDIWVRKSLRDLATSKPTLESVEQIVSDLWWACVFAHLCCHDGRSKRWLPDEVSLPLRGLKRLPDRCYIVPYPQRKGTSWKLCRAKRPVMRSPVSERSSVLTAPVVIAHYMHNMPNSPRLKFERIIKKRWPKQKRRRVVIIFYIDNTWCWVLPLLISRESEVLWNAIHLEL